MAERVEQRKVLVIGAGIIGVTTAFLLTEMGCHVILLEARQGVAEGTSFANGGQLSYSYADAMASPGLVKKMPKILSGRDPAFKISPFQPPAAIGWTGRFLCNATAENEARNSHRLMTISQHSQKMMNELNARHQLEFNFRKSGKLIAYSDEQAFAQALPRVVEKNSRGFKVKALSAADCIALEPGLAGIKERLVGGIYSEDDEVGDSFLFANQLVKIMQSSGCLDLRYGCKVTGVRRAGGQVKSVQTTAGELTADAYVLAVGPDSAKLGKQFGMRLPVYPVKGYSITVPARDGAPQIPVTDIENKLVIGRIGDQLRIAGCADLVGYCDEVKPERIRHLLDIARASFPDAGDYDQLLHQWSGFRPVTPSSVPIVGQAAENLYLNLGHGMLGWTLALGSASLVAADISGKSAPYDSAGIRPADHGVVEI